MKVWVDDERAAPEGWKWAKSYKIATGYLSTGKVSMISLDHDLGENYTGYDVAKFIVENNIWPKIIFIHTMNSVGRDNIKQLLNHYAPYGVKIT